MSNSKNTKLVNIYPYGGVILSVNPPIRGTVFRAIKSISDIRKCIIARAKVEEILPDGSKLVLDFSNYDKDNASGIKVHDDRKTISQVKTILNTPTAESLGNDSKNALIKAMEAKSLTNDEQKPVEDSKESVVEFKENVEVGEKLDISIEDEKPTQESTSAVEPENKPNPASQSGNVVMIDEVIDNVVIPNANDTKLEQNTQTHKSTKRMSKAERRRIRREQQEKQQEKTPE